jgi:DNA replicative helicase MCM subunit Mcm2 (Cdc46/Mcm family)
VFELIQKDNVAGTMLLRYPTMLLNVLEDAIYKAQMVVLGEVLNEHGNDESALANTTNGGVPWNVKGRRHSRDETAFTRVHPRLVHLPPHSSCCKPSLSSIHATDMGRIVQLTGTVVRASPVRMYECARQFRCAQKGGCKGIFTIEADMMQTNNALNAPTCCPGIMPANTAVLDTDDNGINDNYESGGGGGGGGGGRGGRGRGRGGRYGGGGGRFGGGGGGGGNASRPKLAGDKCRGTKLEIAQSMHTDYQELKIQESATQVGSIGAIPRSLLIKVEDDLVDLCKPGDDVVVVGSLMPQWQPVAASIQVDIGVALRAHSIRVLNEENDGNHATTWDDTLPHNGNARNKLRQEFDELWGYENVNDASATKKNDNNNQDTSTDTDADANGHLSLKRSLATRNYICQSVCPKLYGLRTIKLALLLTLIGGVSDVNSNNGSGNASSNGTTVEEELHKMTQAAASRPNTNDGNGRDNNIEGRNNHSIIAEDEAVVPEQFSLFGNGNHNSDSDLSPNKKKTYCDQQTVSDIPNKQSATATGGSTTSTSTNNNNGSVKTRRREQSHLLLVGDPGTGKSQLLRFAAALSPRSVLTTGVGTTSAGLTCAAVRDSGGGSGKEFVLEAGALVLADRGVCCIDEFGCIQKNDRTTIHEAMEQQTLSIAKAGIVCKLNCRTTILAATNPRGNLYEIEKSLEENTGIGSPLLSRFDLIFKMVDSSDFQRDDRIATHLLNDAIRGGGGSFLSSVPDAADADDDDKDKDVKDMHQTRHPHKPKQPKQKMNPLLSNNSHIQGQGTKKEVWNIDKLRAYIANIKSRFRPTFSPEAARVLQTHYEQCRLKSGSNSTMHTTVRMFEGLIRLSQAHARLMYRPVVTLQDAVAVVLLMEQSAYTRGGFNPTFSEDSEFYRDPMTADDDEEDDYTNNDNGNGQGGGDGQQPQQDYSTDPDCIFEEDQKALLLSYGLADLLPPESFENDEYNNNHSNGANVSYAAGGANQTQTTTDNNISHLWANYHQAQHGTFDATGAPYPSDGGQYRPQAQAATCATQVQFQPQPQHQRSPPSGMTMPTDNQNGSTQRLFTQHTDCYGRKHVKPLMTPASHRSKRRRPGPGGGSC